MIKKLQKYFLWGILMLGILYYPFHYAKGYFQHGYTPVHMAVLEKNYKALELLIFYGADVNANDNNGRTPLHHAVRRGVKISIIELLIDHGAAVNAKDNQGATPLHLSDHYLQRGDIRVAHELLVRGADINAKDKNGETVLNYFDKIAKPVCFHLYDPQVIRKMRELLVLMGARWGRVPDSIYSCEPFGKSPIPPEVLAVAMEEGREPTTIPFRFSMDDLFFPGTARLISHASNVIIETIRPTMLDGVVDIQVEGYMDEVSKSSAKFSTNWDLSIARASKVAKIIVKKMRFPPERISVKGSGKSKPLRPNTSHENQTLNSQIVIIIRKDPHVLALKEKSDLEEKKKNRN